MILTEEQYTTVYGDLVGVEVPEYKLFTTKPKSDREFIVKYCRWRIWRLCSGMYSIINKRGDKIPFDMNYAQHIVYAALLRHPRLLILKSRQQGISTFFLILYFDKICWTKDTLGGLQSYGLKESSALIKRLETAWDNFPTALKNYLGIERTVKNTQGLALSNGCSLRVQLSFRGDTLHLLHVSELGKIAKENPQRAKELRKGTLQALAQGNWGAIESTSEGPGNLFHSMWIAAKSLPESQRTLKDFLPVFLPWINDPDCTLNIPQMIPADVQEYFDKVELDTGKSLTSQQKWWAVATMRELEDGDEDVDFNQEYPYSEESAFLMGRNGLYYSRQWTKSGTEWNPLERAIALYDRRLPVYTSWDIGRNDEMCIIFWQIHKYELRCINIFSDSGEELRYYVAILVNFSEELGYEYGGHALPHDVGVTDVSADKSRLQLLRSYGLKNIIKVKRSANIMEDIDVVRRAIPYMIVDTEHAKKVIDTFHNYSKKWNDTLGVFADVPKHDEWSHPADAVRTMVLSSLWKFPDDPDTEKSDTSNDDDDVIDGMYI